MRADKPKWDRNADGTPRKNSAVNARLALDEIEWAEMPHPDKFILRAVADRVEERCGYRPTERVIQRVIEDMVLLL